MDEAPRDEVLNQDEAGAGVTMQTGTEAISPVIAAILGTSIAAAVRRGETGDVVHGLIAGLRVLRTTVEAEAGYTMAAAFDTAVRTRFLADNLAKLRTTGEAPAATALPDRGPDAAAVATIFENAAESCLTVNAHAEDNGPLEQAIFAFTGQLLHHLGGAPEWRELSGELRRPSGQALDAETEVTLH